MGISPASYDRCVMLKSARNSREENDGDDARPDPTTNTSHRKRPRRGDRYPPSATRTFLCTLEIFDQIEQESLDVAIWASADGQDFGAKPILRIPQRFYRGDTRQILDLSHLPAANFIRASWELVRWGRVAPHPMFVIGLRAEEVPASKVGYSTYRG